MFNTRNDAIIEELKLQREAAIKAFEVVTMMKNEDIAEFFYTKFQVGEDVPFSVLEEIPVGQALILPVVYGGAIITTKLADKSDEIAKYETKWTAGSTLTWHFHSDCVEVITVSEGKIKVYVQGSVHILERNQKLEIGLGIGHQITALTNTILDMKFTKVSN